MNKLIVIISVVLSLFVGQAQAQTTSNELLEKTSSYLKEQGFQISPNGAGVIAVSNDVELSVNVYSDPSLPLPLLRISTCVATFENKTDLDVWGFMNALNTNSPVIKFTATGSQKGDYALIYGGNPEELIHFVYATIDLYYSSDDSIKKLIGVYAQSLKEIKKGMPANLNN